MHIPKTGGHTLRAVLSTVYGDALCPAQNWAELVNTDVSKYKVFIGHFGRQVETLLGDDVQYVVFLREPNERLMSLYIYLKKTGQIDPGASLLTYLTEIAPKRHEHNQMVRYLATKPDGTFDPSEALEEIAAFLPSVIVCNFENFSESFRLLAERLSWPTGLAIPRLNAMDDEDAFTVPMDDDTHTALSAANELDKRLWLWVLHGME